MSFRSIELEQCLGESRMDCVSFSVPTGVDMFEADTPNSVEPDLGQVKSFNCATVERRAQLRCQQGRKRSALIKLTVWRRWHLAKVCTHVEPKAAA